MQLRSPSPDRPLPDLPPLPPLPGQNGQDDQDLSDEVDEEYEDQSDQTLETSPSAPPLPPLFAGRTRFGSWLMDYLSTQRMKTASFGLSANSVPINSLAKRHFPNKTATCETPNFHQFSDRPILILGVI